MPPSDGTLLEALLAVHETLETQGIDHALCGGLAANLYRDEVRATNDVDIYVVVSPAKVVSLTRVFESEGWAVHPAWQGGDQLRLDRPDLPRVDCLIAGTDYEKEAVANAVRAQIAGHEIRVLSAEDLVVFKLTAGRARDYEAVAAIINSVGKEMDTEYVEHKLAGIAMSDRWDRALREADLERPIDE